MNVRSLHARDTQILRRWPHLSPGFTAALVLGWLLVIGYGQWQLLQYAGRPGSVSQPPPQWPAASQLGRNPDRATLVLFLHPHCPCSRATISNLARLIARTPNRFEVAICLVVPRGAPANWERTDLWESCALLPGVSVRVDRDGAEARLFGALTSGQVLAYDTAGRLQFAGGITPARGHEGDCDGMDALLQNWSAPAVAFKQTEVFGCGLFGPQEQQGAAVDGKRQPECNQCPP